MHILHILIMITSAFLLFTICLLFIHYMRHRYYDRERIARIIRRHTKGDI